MVSSNQALKVIDLSKSYRATKALNQVSFEICSGEIFGLLGPNGAGKSTLIHIITSLENADSGEVRVFEKSTTESRNFCKSQMGVVHQEVVQSGYFNVEEILEFQMGYYGLRVSKPRINEVMELLALAEHRRKKVKALSGGMKRRLMIAKAILHQPRLLLLDEPTAGVDVELRKNLWDLVTTLRSQGISILLTTHYLEEAERLCDRVGILHRGEILHIGNTRDVVKEFSRKTFSVQLASALSAENKAKLPMIGAPGASAEVGVGGTDLQVMKVESQFLQISVPESWTFQEACAALNLAMSEVKDIQVHNGNLEEAFSYLTRSSGRAR